MFKVSDMIRNAKDNVYPLERDEQPTQRPFEHAPERAFVPLPPAPKKRQSLLPEDVENEMMITLETIEVLYPLKQEARDRIMKMIVDTLALYPKQKPEPAAEHPEGSTV